MRKYTDSYGARCIELEHYRIRIRHPDVCVYCVNAGRKTDDYMDDVATYVTATSMEDAEKRALELLRDHIMEVKKEIDATLAELGQAE